ncbi:SDR family NAD(P)-dependent oxidoreductase [Streptomyces sp. TG1A-8]|uniref:SDR family NAD(P)-dependent oxidoreductase n=1 Tax=Streptomyces sp. TG1A-8 TaxID=3051385 RepID=UPI00265BC043|nr:SDR family NAD(P)-dependent oxidoreductase [Streptomyces sp. TG1A-8]MDO0928428.1 SDR family NAD(P)-dependent oxidoreductase [Streptomyces sp. TG1A-8]
MTTHTKTTAARPAAHGGVRTWFITGATSGIGLALARAAAERGDNVAALARRTDALAPLTETHGPRVLALAADVRSAEDLRTAVTTTLQAFGRIDVVANNAGYGLFGAVEESTDAQARDIFDTNVFGVLNVLRATLPVLRAQGGGHILQGSSYYGQTAHPGVGLLAATKYAVEGLTDALVGELAPLGVKVTVVEPGPTATAFLSNLDVADTLTDYDPTVRAIQKSIGELPASAFNSADRVATAVLAAVDADRPPLRLATGTTAVTEIRAALDARLAELDAWEAVSTAVDTPTTQSDQA